MSARCRPRAPPVFGPRRPVQVMESVRVLGHIERRRGVALPVYWPRCLCARSHGVVHIGVSRFRWRERNGLVAIRESPSPRCWSKVLSGLVVLGFWALTGSTATLAVSCPSRPAVGVTIGSLGQVTVTAHTSAAV